MLEITFWAASRDAAVAFLKAVNIADTDEQGNFVPIAEVQIHPSRVTEAISIVKTPAVMDGMTVVTPAEMVPGWHGNMRFYGASEATLRKPEPVGGWLPEHDLFARTYINELVAGRTGVIPSWTTAGDVPPGYEAGQCRAFDPALITTRANVWA